MDDQLEIVVVMSATELRKEVVESAVEIAVAAAATAARKLVEAVLVLN